MMAVEYLRMWMLLLSCLQVWTTIHFCWAQLHDPTLACGGSETTCWELSPPVALDGIIDLSATTCFRKRAAD